MESRRYPHNPPTRFLVQFRYDCFVSPVDLLVLSVHELTVLDSIIIPWFTVRKVKVDDEIVRAHLRLAIQIQSVVLAVGDYMNVQCHACIGGTSIFGSWSMASTLYLEHLGVFLI